MSEVLKLETAGKIRYGAGYKYQLREDWSIKTNLLGQAARVSGDGGRHYVALRQDGLLTIFAGYAWDGPSGPTFDTPDGMRASLAHDALYQLMRAGKLSEEARAAADQLFYDLLLLDGMHPARAATWYAAVRLFAEGYAARSTPRTLEAP